MYKTRQENKSIDDLEKQNLLQEMIERQTQFLPRKNTDRNEQLRTLIFKRFVSELLTDDERAAYYNLPKGTRIREGAKILSPENLKIGTDCWIGENAVLDASGGLEIGNHTSIGLSVFIWSHSSHLANLALKNTPNSDLITRQKTKIGSGCFISGPSVIMPGVTIGDRVVIKPLSVVDRDIPARSLFDRGEVRENVWSDQKITRLIMRKSNQNS